MLVAQFFMVSVFEHGSFHGTKNRPSCKVSKSHENHWPPNWVKSGFYLANDVAPHAGMSIPLLRPVAKTTYPLRKQQPLTCWIRRVWTFFVMWWYVLQYIYIYYNWLQTWLLFSIIYINIWDNPYHWLIIFRGVEPPTYAMICRYMCSYMSYPVVTSSLSDTRCIFFPLAVPFFDAGTCFQEDFRRCFPHHFQLFNFWTSLCGFSIACWLYISDLHSRSRNTMNCNCTHCSTFWYNFIIT